MDDWEAWTPHTLHRLPAQRPRRRDFGRSSRTSATRIRLPRNLLGSAGHHGTFALKGLAQPRRPLFTATEPINADPVDRPAAFDHSSRIAAADSSNSHGDVRHGRWLRAAEQGCFAILSALLLALLLGWLVLCQWRGSERMEFEQIEFEEAHFEVDPNQAAAEELQLLPGIGPTLAKRIHAFRESHGGFATADDLQQIRGIGQRTVERLTPYIAIPPATGRPPSP